MSDEPAHEEPGCAFCGRDRGEVRRLVTGPKVAICDGCVIRCLERLAEEPGAEAERLRTGVEDARAWRAETARWELDRVRWLAQFQDGKSVAVIAHHLAAACAGSPDVPRPVAERADALARELEALPCR